MNNLSNFIINTYVNRNLTFTRGEGVYLYDEGGNRYLDMMSNYGVSIFGYNYKPITHILREQITKLITLHGSFGNTIRNEASQRLIDRCAQKNAQVYWSNSGAEAIEAALKFAVLTTHKKRFIVCQHGYHGKTLGALSATSGEKYRQPFEPLLWEFVRVPFNDYEALENTIDNKTAGFIVEPIQGEGGIYVPSKTYLQKVRNICTKKNILIILDEIQTGCGRTGTFLTSQKQNVSADIICLGKGLAAGIPIGVTIVSEHIAQSIPKHIHTSTFGGNPLACAGVIATLNALDIERLNHIQIIGTYFIKKLQSLKSPYIDAVRGQGLMIGLSVKDKRNVVLKLLQENHILAIPAGETVIRFLPPYIIEKENIDIVTITLQKIFDSFS